MSVTATRPAGIASFVVDVPDAPLPSTGREVGIDLGLAHFAVLSDGRKVDNPRIARTAAQPPAAPQARPHVRKARNLHGATRQESGLR